MEIDSVSVKADFNSHSEKTETNTVLVFHASVVGLFSSCYVFEHVAELDWMVWKATNEEIKFWHKHVEKTCFIIYTHQALSITIQILNQAYTLAPKNSLKTEIY